jgi:hypothetical protein
MSAPVLRHPIIGLPDRKPPPAATSDSGVGIVGWSLRGLPSDAPVDEVDGIPTTRSRPGGDIRQRSRPGGDIRQKGCPGADSAAPAIHPNGVIAIDHVVLLSPDLGRTVDSLTAVGVNRAGNAMAKSADDRSGRSSSGSGR